ncbi:WD40-like Beta Propeller Repeat [Pedococcus dokdonensis]|uniref:WD40-like Beta Propeller Repeat n=1 Tax=Pedococcus dokdonensis TaxID=443156 RepID=A0A1H0RID6_9MICO|nr:FG-GAP-like repeat-containing protein [Pedococcus dokdonensis]SDP29170.1 WD40-like Beta Propeller Repeat [Pedococcus dokdonensis]
MSSPARVRTGLTLALTAALAVGAVPATQAADSPASRGGADFKVRAVNAMIDAASSRRAAKSEAAANPTASSATTKAADVDKAPDPGLVRNRTLPAPDAVDAAPTCDDLALDWTPTNDRVWVHWNTLGLDNYTILRQRDGGSWKQIGVVGADQTSFVDRTVNPRGLFTYRLDADGISCPLGYWASMSTQDGWGVPDAVFGTAGTGDGTGPLLMQDTFSYGMPSTLTGMDPAYSPDGRLLASAASTDGTSWTLQISEVGPRGVESGYRSSPQPAGTLAAEPSFSPDGRRVVYTRYTVDAATGDVTGSQLRVVDVVTGVDKAVGGSTGLVQADWRSTSTFIAAGGAPGEGLFTIGATGGTKVPVAGTSNAGFPEVAPNGKTYFTTGDGTNFALNVLSTTGVITPLQSSTSHSFETPRVSPDGTVFYVDIDLKVLDDPADNEFTVMSSTNGTDTPEATAIGARRADSSGGFFGYDVRQPKSKGTSDFVGNAGPDILARDSAGTLWAYPSTPDKFAGTRVKIGTGWNIYNAFLAAGDLNGDDKADILARDTAGKLWRYDGKGGGKVAGRVQVGAGWGGYLPLAPGDFNGDGRADLVARSSTGELWLYPGTGLGTFATRTRLGTGWQGMNSIVGVGDFDLDNDADLIAREASTSKLWLYPGNGQGGFSARRQVGSGWNIFKGIAGPELLGPNPFVYAKRADGTLISYAVVGDGRFDGNEVYLVGTGWGPYSFTS